MKRTVRIKGDPERANCYHVMSRTAGGDMLFGRHEKHVFAKQLRKHAAFSGIEVLTWCMMDNHFHLLIRVPDHATLVAGLMANERSGFWKHLRILYSRERVKALKVEIKRMEKEPGEQARERVETMLETYTRRLADLSIFVKELKFAFSTWFNHKHGRRGTLWMERFKSVLLEGEPWVMKKVAAYIDLNPIRAALVRDPGDYRWSGYGEAVGGKMEARRGLSAVYGYGRSEWKSVSRDYRALLFLEGVEVRSADGKLLRAGVSDADFYREIANGGNESAVRRLARQVRYFGEGAAVGSREFLEGVFERNRKLFGPRRKTGARKFRGPQWKGIGLFSLRDLGPGREKA